MSSDPLQSLVVDGDEVVRHKLAAALAGRVGLEPVKDTVHLTTAGGGARERVLLAILGRQALSLIKPGTPDRLKPREIAEMTGIAPGTVRPCIKKLLEDRIVAVEEGAYYVPMAQLDRAVVIVADTTDGGTA